MKAKRANFIFTILLSSLFFSFVQTANADQNVDYRCTWPADGNRSANDIAIMRSALQRLANDIRQDIRVISCYRSAGRQEQLLRNAGCIPYGARNCSHSIARRSQHTHGTAADIHIPGTCPQDIVRKCQALRQLREEVDEDIGRNRGGIGAYGNCTVHFDFGPRRQWNRCSYIGNSERQPSARVQNYIRTRM